VSQVAQVTPLPKRESWTKSGPVVSHLPQDEIEFLEERATATIAAPAPLGLWDFATGTWITGTVIAGMFPPTALTATIPVLLIFAGLTQFIAGLFAFRRANVLSATAFCSFGAFNVLTAPVVRHAGDRLVKRKRCGTVVAPQTDLIHAPQRSPPANELCQYTPHGLLRTTVPHRLRDAVCPRRHRRTDHVSPQRRVAPAGCLRTRKDGWGRNAQSSVCEARPLVPVGPVLSDRPAEGGDQ